MQSANIRQHAHSHTPVSSALSPSQTRADSPSCRCAQQSSCQSWTRSHQTQGQRQPSQQQCALCPSRHCGTRYGTPCTCALLMCQTRSQSRAESHTIRVLVPHKHQIDLVLVDELLQRSAHVHRHNVVALLKQLRRVLQKPSQTILLTSYTDMQTIMRCPVSTIHGVSVRFTLSRSLASQLQCIT